ncbi:MAG: zinc-finger domain-containing protein [Kangiellaceae bacterium]|nr:zinc-finger domain-containing protein [Kangiellaceae bacterium]
MSEAAKDQAVIVKKKDLPISCPPQEGELWNMHPRVYLEFDKSNTASCPYCGATYQLKG